VRKHHPTDAIKKQPINDRREWLEQVIRLPNKLRSRRFSNVARTEERQQGEQNPIGDANTAVVKVLKPPSKIETCSRDQAEQQLAVPS